MRPYRPLIAGAFYHVTTNATGWESLFRSHREREHFLDLLAVVVRRFHWSCQAYCVLGTHFHLMVETPEANLDRGMQRLNGNYAQWYNRKHERRGHLVQDRYHSEVIERESHALEVIRYIAWNPVEAGLCRRPEEWPASSYAAVVAGQPPDFLDIDALLAWFAPKRGAALARLRAFVDRL
jgi:putative transposase